MLGRARGSLTLLTAAVVIFAGACGNGDPVASDPVPNTTATTSAGPVIEVVFRPSFAPFVLAQLAEGIDTRFQFDEGSLEAFDPAAGDEVEYASSRQRERFEFALEHGFLGLFSVIFETPDAGEFWELTVEVFTEEAGARATFEQFGSLGGGAVANSERLSSEDSAFGTGRTGRITVDRYAHRVFAEGEVHEQGEFLELRGTLVDDNVLLHVLAVIDLDRPEAADPLGAVRRALDAVDGTYARVFHQHAAAAVNPNDGE